MTVVGNTLRTAAMIFFYIFHVQKAIFSQLLRAYKDVAACESRPAAVRRIKGRSIYRRSRKDLPYFKS